MRRAAAAAAISAALALAPGAWAAPGVSPFQFLSADFNARALGLGGAYTALADDASALHYNPAGLARVRRYEASLMHSALAEGVAQEHIGFASPGSWGVCVNYLGSGPVARTTISRPNGVGTNAQAYQLAAGGGMARQLGDFSIGLGVKALRGAVDDAGVVAPAFDAGVMYDVPGVRGITVGAAVQNVGPRVRYQGGSEPLPTILRLGAGYGFALAGMRYVAAFDLRQERDGGPLPSGGLEVGLAKMLPVRLGAAARAGGGADLTAGVGFVMKTASFDYATLPLSPFGVQHRLSASVRWGGGELEN